jgi:2-oxoglutarate ferredoxin oxidoreductase subunit alpha
MEQINLHLQEKYRRIQEMEVRYEAVMTDDAEYLLVAYGLVARIAHRAAQLARERGIRVGLIRPITLFPFPGVTLRELALRVKGMLVVEMNAGQMVEDVRLSVEGRVPVLFHGRMGGVIPSPAELLEVIQTRLLTSVTQHAEAL